MTHKQPITLLWLFYFLIFYTPHVFSYISVSSAASCNATEKSYPLTNSKPKASQQHAPTYTTETLYLEPSSNDAWLSLQGNRKYQYADRFSYKNKEYTTLKLSIPSKTHTKTNQYGMNYSPAVNIGSQCQQLCWFNESNKSSNTLTYSFFLLQEMADSPLTVNFIQEKIKKSRQKKSKKRNKNSVNDIRLTSFYDKDNDRFFLDITLNPKELFNQLRHEKKLSPLSILNANPWLKQFNISLLAQITDDGEKKFITIKFQPKDESLNIPENVKPTIFKKEAITVIPKQGRVLSIPCNQSEANHLVTVRAASKSLSTLLGAFVQSFFEFLSEKDLNSFSWPFWEKAIALTACKDAVALAASATLATLGTPIPETAVSMTFSTFPALYRSLKTTSKNSKEKSSIQNEINRVNNEEKLPVLFRSYEVSQQSSSTILTMVSKQNLKVEETPSLLDILQVQREKSVSKIVEHLLSDENSLTDLLEPSTLLQVCSSDKQLQSNAHALNISDPESWLKNTLENFSRKEPKMTTSSELVDYMLTHIYEDDVCQKAIALLFGCTVYSSTSQKARWLLKEQNLPSKDCIVVLEPVLSFNKKSQPKPASGNFTRSAAFLTQKTTLIGIFLYGFLPKALSMPTSTSGLTTIAPPISSFDMSYSDIDPTLTVICSKYYKQHVSIGASTEYCSDASIFCRNFNLKNAPATSALTTDIRALLKIQSVRDYGCNPYSINNPLPTNSNSAQELTTSHDKCMTNYAKNQCTTLVAQKNTTLEGCKVCETSIDPKLRCGYKPTTTGPATTEPTTGPATTEPTTGPATTTGVTTPSVTTTITTGTVVATEWTIGQVVVTTLGVAAVLSYVVNLFLGARGWDLVASPITVAPNIYNKCYRTQSEPPISNPTTATVENEELL